MNQTAPPETVIPPLPAQQQDIPSTMAFEQVKTLSKDTPPGRPGQPAELVGLTGGKPIQ